jgi:hypothetical protein
MPAYEDVMFLNDRYSLCHYIIFKLAAANLPGKPILSAEHSQLIEYSEDSKARIREFIAFCVSEWNKNHTEQLDTSEITELVRDMRERDIKEFEKSALLPR